MSTPSSSLRSGQTVAWVGHIGLIAGVAAASIVLAIAAELLKQLVHGDDVDMAALLSMPLDPAAWWYILVPLAIFAMECAYSGWRDSPLRLLLMADSSSCRSDVFYFASDVFALSPMLTVTLTLGASAVIDGWLEAPRGWRPAANLPLWLAAPLFFLADDVVTYWAHRFMHSRLMWPLHAVHHAVRDMNALSAFREHPIDKFVGVLPGTAVATFLAFPADAVFVTSLFAGAAAIAFHGRLPWPYWIECYIIAGPRYHGIHHSIDSADFNSNLGQLPVVDRLFGTYRWHDRPLVSGIADPCFDSGRPLRDIATVYAIWLRGVRAEGLGLLRRVTGRAAWEGARTS